MKRAQATLGKWVQCRRCAFVAGPLGPLTEPQLKLQHEGSEKGLCSGTMAVTDADGLLSLLLSGKRLYPVARKLLVGVLVHLAQRAAYVEGAHLGQLLKHARQEQGLSQAQVAERLRAAGARGTQTTVGDSERLGPQLLTVAQKHAEALGLRVLYALAPLASQQSKEGP